MSFVMPEFGPALWAVCAAVAVAGLVRGFSGFGSGLIVGAVAAAAYGPKVAVVILLLIETLPMLPLFIAAWKKVRLAELAPIIAGFAITLPAGLWLLTTTDPTILRWFMFVVIVSVVIALWSGWHYTGPRNVPVRVGVGGMSGFLGGSVGAAGPPVILYWMALRTGAGFVRANLIIYFGLTTMFAVIGLYFNGLLTASSVSIGITVAPIFLVTTLIGAWLFGLASEATYRRIALIIILATAFISMPALDGLRG